MPLVGKDFGCALAMAAAFNYDNGTVETLLKAGADVNPKHYGGRYSSPLIAAACFGQKDCVEYLIKAGADVNRRLAKIPYLTALEAAQAGLSLEDEEWILRQFDSCGAEKAERGLEERKLEVVQLLQGHGAII